MKNTNLKPVLAAALSALALFVSGCVSTPDGHTQFGIPWLSKDTSTSRYERSVKQVADATRKVLDRDGKPLVDNSIDSTFKAKVNERNVYVKITKVDDKVTELLVMVRSTFNGDIDLAHELDKQIALEMVNP
jgi:hypothetical protein